MANDTIGDLNDLIPPMDGTELMEVERTGTSYRVHAGDVAQAPPVAQAIISHPVSQDLDPLALLYIVTTGGSAGVDLLNLPNPTLDGNGVNVGFVGRRVVICLDTQTDPADTVKITVAGSAEVPFFEGSNSAGILKVSDVTLYGPGSAVAFTWQFDQWGLDGNFTDFFFTSTNSSPVTKTFSGGNATASFAAQGALFKGGDGNVAHPQGANANLQGGNSNGATKGGNAVVEAGESDTGPGGDVVLQVGNSPGGTGNVLLTIPPPTSDPGVPGAIWADPVTHILKISP